MDINLPDIDGWRVLNRLKDDVNTRHIPVHLITTDEERERPLRMGAMGVLTKPVKTKETLDETFDRVKRFIEPHQRRVVVVEQDPAQQKSACESVAGPETEVSADKTKATTRMREVVQDGVLQRSWCIIPGDPPGTYTYDISIDGEPRGEFVFCAIEVPDQNTNIDPRDLKYWRNVCGYWFRPQDDRFRWRDRLRLARPGLAEVVIFTLLFGLVCIPLAIVAVVLHPALWIGPGMLTLVWLWMISFFRDPERQIPTDPRALLSPADVATPIWIIPIAKGGDRIKEEPAK